MKKLIVLASVILLSGATFAENNPLWMRYPAVSPDGKTIAFTYKGDIFTVPVTGGRAMQLTTNPAYDTRPIWSPDGSRIAFASNREGSFDVFVVDNSGGVPKRLTSHSAAEYPETFRDNEHLLYSATIMQDVNDIQFPNGMYSQIYEISLRGGRPKMFSSLVMQGMSLNKKGDKLLYHDLKGYEDQWRKHHKSSIARNIWLCDNINGKRTYSKLTSFKGEDRNPVWTPDGNSYYFLSERGGTFNVFKSALGTSDAKQITNHVNHPVRFLSSSSDGLLCYGYDGEIYTLREGGKPAKVAISIVSDKNENDIVHQVMRGGSTSMAISPNGKEVAFIVRGDVYVTSVDYETTQRITNTPQQERNVDFSPDGRSIVYSSERGATWGIYQSTLVRKEDKYFAYAHEIKEEPLVVTDKTSFQPSYSPDGKEVAFLEDRTTLRVINLKSRKVRTVLEGKYNYSYSDGDRSYNWSPDSKWFLTDYIGIGGWNNKDVALVKADGSGEVINLTESGYSDGNAKWVLDGKAMIWASDRAGFRSHGSWGAHTDVYIMFFDGEAYDKFRMNKEDLALSEEAAKNDGKKEEDKPSDDKNGDKKKSNGKSKEKKTDEKKTEKDEKSKDEKTLVFDLDNRRDRIMRLTINSSNLSDAVLTPTGDKLYYSAAFEGGFDLWERNFRENSTRIVIKGLGGGGMDFDKSGKNIYLLTGGQMKKIEASANKVSNISFRADFDLRHPQEREYIFNHVWRQVQDKFYDPTIHGVDWSLYKTAYERFLPHVNNNYDFVELLSELLGELNGSHTGARYGGSTWAPATASLGAFYDNAYEGDGLKVAEVLAKGPLTKAGSKIKPGCIIEKIDGEQIKAGVDYYPMLNGKVGKKVLLSVYDPSARKHFEQEVKAISSGEERSLLYKRWVESRRRIVDEMSGGKVGYVHVQGMNSESFREVYSELLGRCRNKEAVIVDTRHNGGGWLHDDLATLLSGKEYQQFAPRGKYIGSDPFNKWLKPSCVLVCEDNYSNAHGFPWVYKTLGIGKLIGAPVPGTMTAVWWETQIDPSIVFGIPQVGVRDMQGHYLENMELQPDIEVYNSPEEQLSGKDTQLEKAVEAMLQTIETK